MGLSLFVLFWFQPLNGLLRPHPPKAGGEPTVARRGWELFHRNFGRGLLLWGLFIILTGPTVPPPAPLCSDGAMRPATLRSESDAAGEVPCNAGFVMLRFIRF